MPLEIKVLDYGDIELESSFLVLGRDCGRTRRVPTLGFLILGGAYPILVDTGYRSNQIMETLGMRGLQFHENMIENQLSKHGVRMGDVRFVLHTHLHIDHAGKDDLFPMNSTVVVNRKELEYSVSGLQHPQYPAPDIKHLIDRLHAKSALRFLDLEISGPVELMPGVFCEAAAAHTEGIDERARSHRRRRGDDLRRRHLRHQRPDRGAVSPEQRRRAADHRQPWHDQARREGAPSRRCSPTPASSCRCTIARPKSSSGVVVARLQDSVPGPIVQTLPKRNWFPA